MRLFVCTCGAMSLAGYDEDRLLAMAERGDLFAVDVASPSAESRCLRFHLPSLLDTADRRRGDWQHILQDTLARVPTNPTRPRLAAFFNCGHEMVSKLVREGAIRAARGADPAAKPLPLDRQSVVRFIQRRAIQ